MSDERMRILKMLESRQISAKEAADLLAALDKPQPPKATGGPEAMRGRWLRVQVTDLATGKVKVNVNVPLGLVDVALRMGARFSPKTETIDPQELLEAIRSGSKGKLVDVEDQEKGEHVEIFVD